MCGERTFRRSHALLVCKQTMLAETGGKKKMYTVTCNHLHRAVQQQSFSVENVGACERERSRNRSGAGQKSSDERQRSKQQLSGYGKRMWQAAAERGERGHESAADRALNGLKWPLKICSKLSIGCRRESHFIIKSS